MAAAVIKALQVLLRVMCWGSLVPGLWVLGLWVCAVLGRAALGKPSFSRSH